ncbi:MAG: sodium:solute symporter family transporter [Planctomycetia bacterium]|jgi:SSS family solute:Na+ symporter
MDRTMQEHAFVVWDYLVLAFYFCMMLVIGIRAHRHQKKSDEYFLAHREIPWYAIGLSIVATLISSLSYISEPGEVFLSGFTNIAGKFLAILLETGFVLFLFIPFLMRFRFTSAYEYLGYRFNDSARRLGVVFFSLQTVAWMGFVILAMARTMSEVTGFHLGLIIWVIGLVTTIYTMIGGYRGVVWTDVAQFFLMFGGALACILFVGWKTSSTPMDWIGTAMEVHGKQSRTQIISFDPFQRTSVVTFAITMFVWHACIHLGNQMTVQRYFSTTDLPMARKSFVLAVVGNLAINSVLVLVGLAILHESTHGGSAVDLSQEKKADMIFPRFMVQYLPPGLAGGVLTAVLAAAMSTISSGFNSLATVLTMELKNHKEDNKLAFATRITLLGGLVSTILAFGIDLLVKDRNIVEMMPRSFNCFTAPLGGMFLVGIFIPQIRAKATVGAALIALFAAVLVSYGKEIFGLERNISFTLVMPISLAVMVVSAVFLNLVIQEPSKDISGLTWFSMNEKPNMDPSLVSDFKGVS